MSRSSWAATRVCWFSELHAATGSSRAAHDITIVKDNQRGKPLPAERWAPVTTPTLVVAGGKSPAWMRHGMRALADILPNAEHRVLDGQTHLVKPKVLAPALEEFFAGSNRPEPVLDHHPAAAAHAS
jgi:pimeloyl-ACP methyl ester carboxylesterase